MRKKGKKKKYQAKTRKEKKRKEKKRKKKTNIQLLKLVLRKTPYGLPVGREKGGSISMLRRLGRTRELVMYWRNQ